MKDSFDYVLIFAAILFILGLGSLGIRHYQFRQELHATFNQMKYNNEEIIRQMDENLQLLRECNDIARELNRR